MKNKNGRVLWITGLSGAGKTTLANALAETLRRSNNNLILLDGDELREVFGSQATAGCHDRDSRLDLAMRYSRLCRILSSQGATVIIATISMFKEVHEWNRANIEGYFEIYLKVPVEELQRRDPKEIYSRYAKGELKNVAGLDIDIDEPADPDIMVGHDESSDADELLQSVINKLPKELYS